MGLIAQSLKEVADRAFKFVGVHSLQEFGHTNLCLPFSELSLLPLLLRQFNLPLPSFPISNNPPFLLGTRIAQRIIPQGAYNPVGTRTAGVFFVSVLFLASLS